MSPTDVGSPDPGARIKNRFFWTWDHSMEWVLNSTGAQTYGANNPYTRTPATFIEDYKRLLTWCAEHHIDGVVAWGLLRDGHGGLDAARVLCEYAKEVGVRLMSGVGLNAYGGIYYEGDSPYSLITHLERHPELYALDVEGRPLRDLANRVHLACPSRRENQEFAADSLRWLMESLPLGGVQIEAGDTGVCQCKTCRERRQYPAGVFSWEDMALMYPLATDAVRSVDPDAWIACETYSHPQPLQDPDTIPTFGDGKPHWADACIDQFPEGVFVQWVADRFADPKQQYAWTDAAHVDTGLRQHVMRAHLATYWFGMRGELALDWLADMVRSSLSSGFDCMSLFGEVSPFCVGAELNYLALEHFGSDRNPDASVDVFVRDVAAPLLGGEAEAREFVRYAVAARQAEYKGEIPAVLRRIYRHIAALPDEPARRWVWLAHHLNSLMVTV